MGKKTKASGKAFAHVNAVRRRDGSIDYYHRVAKVRLPDAYGSPEFAEAWAAAEKSVRTAAPRAAAMGTFQDLVAAFEASPEWEALAERTRADYGKVRDWFFAEGAARAYTRELTQERCEKILARAVEETNWRFAVYVLQYGRRLWNWAQEKAARKKRWGEGNPWRDIPTPPRPRSARRKANRPWKPEELTCVLERAPIGLRRAYVLGACGFDGGSMIKLRWSDYNEAGGVFTGQARQKTDVGGYTIVYAALRPFLEAGERKSEFIVTNALGEPFALANTLQTRSSDFLGRLARDGLVGDGLTLHGLRHTLAKAIADAGGDIRAIQAALRHSTERMSLHYSKNASARRAAETAAGAVSDFFASGKGRADD